MWPHKLAVITFAYNSTVNRMTGVSPFEMTFGYKPTLPVDFVFPLERPQGQTCSNFITDLKLKFQKAYQAVIKTEQKRVSLEACRISGREYNQTRIKTGDIVYYFLGQVKRGISLKLQKRWIGPFEVKRKVSDSLFIIYQKANVQSIGEA